MPTSWTPAEKIGMQFLSQESSIFDLLLQEDGYKLIVGMGTEWDGEDKNPTNWSAVNTSEETTSWTAQGKNPTSWTPAVASEEIVYIVTDAGDNVLVGLNEDQTLITKEKSSWVAQQKS